MIATPLQAESLGQLRSDIDVAVAVDLALRELGAGGLDAEDFLRVLLVADAVVDVRHQAAHDLLGSFGAPELLAIVQVAAHRQAELLGRADTVQDGPCRGLGQGRGDAGEVEPVAILRRSPASRARRGSTSEIALWARS